MKPDARRALSLLLLVLLALGAVCSCTLLPVRRESVKENFAGATLSRSDDPFPNWPLPPDRIEELIRGQQFVVESKTAAGGGTTGAERVSLYFPSANVTLQFKWKRMDGAWKPFWGRLDGINNSPRKEIAAWAIQEIFLDPEDYVVPLSRVYAAPAAHTTPPSTPTLPGSGSLLGILTVWLENATFPDRLLDNERFSHDYAYAYYLANFNLLTYLIKHHDGRPGNFLVSKDDARRQVFAIDNGVAFGGSFYNWFAENWNSIRVPALRRESIDRLRQIREDDLHKLLGVIAQLEMNDDGLYSNASLGDNLDDDDGVRIEGKVLQLGLTEDEIEDVWERIEDLIEDVDDGKIPVF